MVWARQLGKSILLGTFSLWCAFNNSYSCTAEEITPIYLVSRDDDTAVELLSKMKGLVKKNDIVREAAGKNALWGHVRNDNAHELILFAGSFIKSLPPTETVLGKSAGVFIIDEAAKLRITNPLTESRYYKEFVEPTLQETNGLWIVSSTPYGEQGEFFRIIDPYDAFSTEFDIIWFPYTISKDRGYKDRILKLKEKAIKTSPSELRMWEQEYMAKFTTTRDAFFTEEQIASMTDGDYEFLESCASPCSLGVDYGMSHSRTVLSIRTMIGDKCVLVYQKRFPEGFNNELLIEEFPDSIPSISKKYNISWIVPDDCPAGDAVNKWLVSKGYPLISNRPDGIGFSFRTDALQERNRAYYRYRAGLMDDSWIRIPRSNILQVSEMRLIEEEQLMTSTRIKAAGSGLCDTVDSDVMACFPFFEQEQSLQSSFSFPEEQKKQPYDPRKDTGWDDAANRTMPWSYEIWR